MTVSTSSKGFIRLDFFFLTKGTQVCTTYIYERQKEAKNTLLCGLCTINMDHCQTTVPHTISPTLVILPRNVSSVFQMHNKCLPVILSYLIFSFCSCNYVTKMTCMYLNGCGHVFVTDQSIVSLPKALHEEGRCSRVNFHTDTHMHTILSVPLFTQYPQTIVASIES